MDRKREARLNKEVDEGTEGKGRTSSFTLRILLPSSRGYGARRADSGRSYHFSGGDWPRGGWRMRTGCLLLLPTLTFLTSLLAALFARDRLCEAFLDRYCLTGSSFFFYFALAASLPNRNFLSSLLHPSWLLFSSMEMRQPSHSELMSYGHYLPLATYLIT